MGRLERLGQASGIFFTGGNQLRLTTLLGGTPVAKVIRTRNAHGVTVGADWKRDRIIDTCREGGVRVE